MVMMMGVLLGMHLVPRSSTTDDSRGSAGGGSPNGSGGDAVRESAMICDREGRERGVNGR